MSFVDETSGPAGLVNAGFRQQRTYGDEAFKRALEFVSEISDLADKIDIPDILYTFPDLDVPNTSVDIGSPPDAPVFSIVFPELPDFSLGSVPDPSVPTPPEFNLTPPSVSLPAPPPALDIDAPENTYNINVDFDYPDDPEYTLPSVPDLRELTIPSTPSLDIPESFDEEAPEITVPVPGNTFSFTEQAYSSTLLDDLKDSLLSRLTGGTGLPADVEEAIWNRARTREELNAKRTTYEVYNEHAARGFNLPDGVLLDKLQRAAQEAQDNLSTVNRDIAIEQARLEQENLTQTISQVVQLESTLINYESQVQQRAFEAARYAQETSIAIYNAYVQQFQIELQKYQTAVEVYNARIRAELAKLEVYRSELEGQRLIGDLNEQDIRVYASQLEAIRTQADVFRTQVEAVRTKLEAENTKLNIFRTEVDAYGAQVQAKATEYDNYLAQIQGELAKTDVYNTQVQAFSSRVGAYAAQVDAQSTLSSTRLEKERLRLETFNSTSSNILNQSEQKLNRARLETEAYNLQIQRYLARLEGQVANANEIHQSFRDSVSAAETEGRLEITRADNNARNYLAANELYLNASEGGARVSAQLAASALSAVNLAASISGSSSDSYIEQVTYEGGAPP